MKFRTLSSKSGQRCHQNHDEQPAPFHDYRDGLSSKRGRFARSPAVPCHQNHDILTYHLGAAVWCSRAAFSSHSRRAGE